MSWFVMNDILWHVKRVHPESVLLFDRTGHQTVATTDPTTHAVYLSEALDGGFLRRVLTHELVHCLLISFGMLPELHHMAKDDERIALEEWACNLIADFAPFVLSICNSLEV